MLHDQQKMEALTQSDLINSLTAKTASHLQEVKNYFLDQQEEVLLRPSASGGWSIAQCLEHLNSYGDYYLPAIQSALNQQERKPERLFKSGWAGSYFTRMMESPSKKYKAFKNYIPAQHLDAEAVIKEFIRQQEILLDYLHQAEQKDLNVRLPISISKFIKLKLGDVLQFLIAHNERHIRQALKNL